MVNIIGVGPDQKTPKMEGKMKVSNLTMATSLMRVQT